MAALRRRAIIGANAEMPMVFLLVAVEANVPSVMLRPPEIIGLPCDMLGFKININFQRSNYQSCEQTHLG